MNPNNKKIFNLILAIILIISIFIFYFFFQNAVKKEKEMNSKIDKKVNHLKIIQKGIAENIGKIKEIGIPSLRYGYSFNKNDQYFISKILNDSKKYYVKLSYVKLSYFKKHKSREIYSFKISGYGKPKNIYLFIKTLEYNDKIQLNKFLIKNKTNRDYVSFYSDLSVYAIKKTDVLTHILKYKLNLTPPPQTFGAINPFFAPAVSKKYVKKIKSAGKYPPEVKSKKLKIEKEKISNKAYEKLAYKSKLKKSDYYNKKGVAFFVREDYGRAFEMFKKAIALNPSNYQALSNAALDNYEKKDYNSALLYGKEALKQKNVWQINFILGLIYLRSGDFSRAKHYFAKSLELNPSNYKIKYYLNIAEKGR